ncbi:NAD-binding protein [Schizopora paradoxa]|uniref:NAD-binding protein n=1 Tax=Schizopora paradoxa TaxID=27342 RepID=A0A0H2S0T6_9AGAM|nr:NAD-binding protein [Schizopora paradoxa]
MSVSNTHLGSKPAEHLLPYDAIDPANFQNALKDKVALVTGAGRGIGRAIALAFAEAGADVALLSRTKSQLDEVANIITTTHHRRALVLPADATEKAAIEDAFARTESELGKVDIVVANAASFVFRPFVYTPIDEWWNMMEANVKGPMILTQLAMKSMRERNEGAILVISSRAGIHDTAGLSAYSTSKTALIRAVGCLQLELDAEGKSGVHMYAVHPGGVKTALAQAGSSVSDDMDKMTPGSVQRIRDNFNSFVTPPELCGRTCVLLAMGKAKELRGRYIDVRNDIESVVEQAEIVKKNGLYSLGIRELGGTVP